MALLSLIWLAAVVLTIVGMWTVFTKAGQPGWASIVPIYNVVVMLEIVGKPTWWVILFFVPIANIVVAILVAIGVANAFGKDSGFGIGLAFLPFVFYPILAFGDAQYGGGGGPTPAEPI